ncbi:hypothetical protein TNCV_496511 [Trichonephila clavipes]|nr:hypothetical protein TNCV_496511 [Trichonephila clavipes]
MNQLYLIAVRWFLLKHAYRQQLQGLQHRPSGIGVSDADCGAVGPGSSRKSFRETGGRGREMGDPDHPQGVLPQILDGTEQSRTVTCMVLKAKANDRRKNFVLIRDEFRGP